MAEVSENCVNCAIGNLFNFSGYMGISKTIFNCNHANKEIVGKKSALFIFKKSLAIFSLLIITAANYYATRRTCEAVKDNGSLFDLLLVNFDGLLYLIATSTIIHSMSQNRRINHMLMFFDSVLKEFNAGTSCSLLSKDDVIFYRTRTYLNLIVTCVFFTSSAICVYCTNLEQKWNTIERLGLLLSLYSCYMLIDIALLFLRLIYCVNAKYKSFLKIDLENLSNDCISPSHQNQNCTIVALPRANVEKLLKVYAVTYIEFIKIFKDFNKICNPIILIFLLLVTLFCIISVFLIIICIESNIPITMRFLSAEFGMQFIILSTGYCIVKFAKINTLNKEELTLLRKFPSSRLSNSERLRFDCFLNIVKRYQPNLEASEIVTMNNTLFASMLSTILTYVLVAVQFEYL